MKSDPELPNRFAKLVINELAEIHAELETVRRLLLADMALRQKGSAAAAVKLLKQIGPPKNRKSAAEMLKELGL